MIEREIEIKEPIGIHARPAALLVKTLKEFKSELKLEKDGKVASSKSLIQIMGLGAKQGDKLKITAEGEDAEEMMNAFLEFAKDNL